MTNNEIAKEWFDAIDANNFDKVKSLMDSKHSFQNPMTPAPVGIDEHIGMMQMMTSALKGQHHVELLISEGEYLTAKGRWAGKHIGVFMGVPATNNDVAFSWIDVFHIVNGKVVEEHMEMNPMAIMTQIGAMPANA